MTLQNDVFLKACLGDAVPYTPVWLMRQAGRYLPEYRATRARAGSFMSLCRSPELCAEVTLQPIDRYPLDASIVFSDILTVPDAMGLGLTFAEGEGPRFAKVANDEASINALSVPDMNDLRYVFDAISACRKALNGRVPLIGFSGSPFTLACYMTTGRGEEGYPQTKQLLYRRPDLFEKLLAINTEAVAQYLGEQVKAGAQALMIFDSWGGILAPHDYRQYSLEPMRQVIARLPKQADGRRIPIILFSKGAAGHSLRQMGEVGADVIGLDWTCDTGEARQLIGNTTTLQGNLDPLLLSSTEHSIAHNVKRILASGVRHSNGSGFIFNLGHGITPSASPDLVRYLIDTVHLQSKAA